MGILPGTTGCWHPTKARQSSGQHRSSRAWLRNTYLTVQVISHIDDIVENVAHLLDWEAFRVPIRGWRCDGKLCIWDQLPQRNQERQVVLAIRGVGRRNAGDIRGLTRREKWSASKLFGSIRDTHSGILPIDIDAIQAIRLHKVGNIVGHGLSIGCCHTIAEDHISAWVRRESPATNGKNLLRACREQELLELKRGGCIADLNVVVRVKSSERIEEVRVRGGIQLRSVLVQAGSSKVVPFEKRDIQILCWWAAAYDVGAAVGDTAVGAWFGCSWSTSG